MAFSVYLFTRATIFQSGRNSESKFVRLHDLIHQRSAIPEWEQHSFPDAHSFKEVIRKTGDIKQLNTNSFGIFFAKLRHLMMLYHTR